MSRVPRPSDERREWRREVATGGSPTSALIAALDESPIRAGIWSVAVRHDDGCAAINGGSMAACTCELVMLEARRAA
jgi:hypothetical protein